MSEYTSKIILNKLRMSLKQTSKEPMSMMDEKEKHDWEEAYSGSEKMLILASIHLETIRKKKLTGKEAVLRRELAEKLRKMAVHLLDYDALN